MIVEHVTQEPRRSTGLRTADGEPASYRSVSKTAVLTAVFAVFSLTAYLSTALLIFPVIGIILGVFAILGFRRYPDELVGRPLAKSGLGICALCLLAGAGWHTYQYNTEVPPDYQRISFRMLQPTGSMAYSHEMEALDGKKVFVKGFVLPSDQKRNLKNFILVGDWGQCCFGGNPKMTDVIAVTLEGDLRVDYSWRTRHIGGVFHLNKTPKLSAANKDVPRVVYSITADYLK
jgi:hypothetical protein